MKSIPKQSRSLRQAINKHCKGCIYDDLAAGTWRQQVTLCSVTSCELYGVRPTTKSTIPETILDYYCVSPIERQRYGLKNVQIGSFSDKKCDEQGKPTGPANQSEKGPIRAFGSD